MPAFATTLGEAVGLITVIILSKAGKIREKPSNWKEIKRNLLRLSLPLMGTLFLINVCMGILAKAAPQMNLLAEGFPILILTSFLLLFLLLPQLGEFFLGSFARGLRGLEQLFVRLGGSIG